MKEKGHTYNDKKRDVVNDNAAVAIEKDEKNSVSHRGIALRNFYEILETQL